jgi:1,4-dihydroxy-2-naphthoate octaprenyltransferase
VPLPSRRTALLAVALVLVVSVVVGAPASWWGLLALLAVPVAAVWLLVGAVRRAHRRNSLPEV